MTTITLKRISRLDVQYTIAMMVACFFLFTWIEASAADGLPQTREVEFKIEDESYVGEEVTTEGSHFLNQLAKSLAADQNGLKIIASEDLLSASSAKGAYSFAQNIMFVSSSVLSEATLNQVVRHELIHAKIWNLVRSNQPPLLSGFLINSVEEFQEFKYGPFFGVDEIVATLYSLLEYQRTFDRGLKPKPDQTKPSDMTLALETVEHISNYS